MSRRTPLCLGLLLLLLPLSLVAAVPLDVRGTVRGPDGRPLAGAQVDLLPLRSNFETSRGLQTGEAGPEPVASVRSDALGRFSVSAPGTAVWKVTVKAAGFVPMQYSPLAVANALELPPLTLTRDAGATVEVRDAKGKPARGIRVYASGNKGSVWSADPNGWRAASRTGITGADGTLRLPRAQGEWLDVSVFQPGSAIPQVARKAESARITLDPAAARPGPVIEVRDGKGKPVPGVLVGVGDLVWPAGTTGSDGRVRLTGRPVQTEDVQLMTADGRRWRGRIEPGQEKAAFEFPPVVRLAGQVVDGVGRKPVAGALVWSGLDPGAFTLSDDKGGYEVMAAVEKDAWVQGEAAGWMPRLAPFELEEMKTGRAPLLVLPPPATLAGVVVDRGGAPVPGVSLGAATSARGGAFRLDKTAGRAVSDAQGRFRFEQLALATPYELTAEKKGFVPATVKVEGKREDLRIVLARTAAPFGRVVDREDKPIVDVEVTLRPEGKKSLVHPTSLRDADEAAPFTARTDATGRFELAEAPAPSVDIAARKKGFASLTVRGVPIPKGEGPVDLGTLVLEPGAGIAGIVTDPSGAGLEGVSVWVSPESFNRSMQVARDRLAGREPDAVTGAEGRFELADLTAGRRVYLYFQRPGYLTGTVPGIEPPAAELVRVTLKPAARVTGRIVDEENKGVAGASVLLRPQDLPLGEVTLPRREEYRSATSNADGEFALEEVPPGRYEVTGSATGFQPPSPSPVRVSAAEETSGVLLVVKRGAVVEGRVTTVDGEPLEGVKVMTGTVAGAATDADGRYRFEGATPGRQTVEARHPRHSRVLREVEIEPGVNTVDFTFPKGNRVAGRVVDGSRSPVAGAAVELRLAQSREYRQHRAITGPDGGFELPEVLDGVYDVGAEKTGYAAAKLPAGVRVAGAPVEGIEVTLPGGVTLSGQISGLSFQELTEVEVTAQGERGEGRTGSVDFQGRYEVADLGPGDWKVKAWLRSGSREVEARLAIAPGARQVRRDLHFGGVTLTGVVLYGGSPMPRANVAVDGEDVTAARSVATDHEGRFRIEDLRPGRYRVGVTHSAEMLVHNEEVVLSGDRDVVLEIATARVSGRVVSLADDKPVAEALVSFLQILAADGRTGSLLALPSDAAGGFVMPRVPPGRYRVAVRKDGYAAAEQELEVPATGIEDLRITLSPTSGLELVVRLASGATPPAATVSVLDPNGRAFLVERRAVGEGGRVALPTVPPGDWTLLVSAPGGAVTQGTARVPGEPVAFVLPDAAPLRVRVPALLESGLAGSLTLLRGDGSPFQGIDTQTGMPVREWRLAGGTAVAEGVPAGAWTVRVVATDGQTWTGPVVTSGRAATQVDLE